MSTVFAVLLKKRSKRKEFALLGSKVCPFKVDAFSEGAWYAGTRKERHKKSPLYKMAEKLTSASRPSP